MKFRHPEIKLGRTLAVKLWKENMKRLIITLMFAAIMGASAQLTGQSLEQIKIAADAGDPVAQDALAVRDSANAEMWYRKAAQQGYAHSEGQLGHRLLSSSRTNFGLKAPDRAAMQDETLKWIILAANQGDAQGQADMALLRLNGELVKQDYVEAYKWGELCSESLHSDLFATPQGRSARDAAILKMDADQIAEAQHRVAAFVPHQPNKSDLPDPAWVQKIKLHGISGAGDHRLAIINDQTLEKGDQTALKIDSKSVKVTCLEIRDSSVSVSIDGIEGNRVLQMTGN
jgi:hypothetical protein